MFNQHHPHHPHPPAPPPPPPPPPPPHQQHFHQQMMQLHHLLHQQHRPLPRPGRGLPPPQPAPPPPHPPPPPPQPQMMNLRPTNRAALLNPNPMLQQALFMQHMQGNIRGFAIRPPAMQHFFTRATRHSILGTPSIGISMKPTHMGFPGVPFQQQNRMYYKDHHTGYDRKRELEPMSSSQAREREIKTTERAGADAPVAGSEAGHVAVSPAEPESQAESVSEDGPEPSAKRLKSLDEEVSDAEAAMAENQEEEEPDSLIRGPNGLQQCEADRICKQQNASVESSTMEMPSTGSSLKVTIQQRSESRAISTTAQKPGQRSSKGTNTAQPALDTGPRFFCYICKSNYHSQETFQYHMATAEHLRRLQEIQHLSDTCLVTFMPIAKENQVTGRDGRKHLQQRWCNACQIHFSGDLIQHRRTPEHKLAKHSLRPFCTVCSRHFKTPRKFVEHMKSPEHKQKAKEERFADKEPGGPEDAEELITVDAVGCFEDDEEEDEEEGIADEENADVVLFEDEECTTRTASVKEDTAQDCEEDEQYCVDTVYGPDFVVPVAGYLCRLCHKFYPSDSAARLAHCKSLMHFQNIQKHRAAKTQAQHESSSCPQNSGATLEDDSKLSLASSLDTENTSQGLGEERPTTEPSEVGNKGSSSLREDANDTDGGHCEKDWPDLKDDMQPLGTEEDGEEEEGADSLEQGDETQGPARGGTLDATEFLEEVSVAKDGTSTSVRRRSSRCKNR